jgi:formate hydrogenlyase subunit 6/NADH:ubiquinone oxidoreductase subunit I
MLTMLKNIFRNLTSRPATRRYPFVVREPIPGSRSRLEIDPAVCIYCGICARRCPANAIAVSKDPKSWTLDPYRCILCGYCTEVCPKKCLSMNPKHGLK